MMHYDIMLHLVSVYIGLSCASLSAVLVFKAEQSYSRAIFNRGIYKMQVCVCGMYHRYMTMYYSYNYMYCVDKCYLFYQVLYSSIKVTGIQDLKNLAFYGQCM